MTHTEIQELKNKGYTILRNKIPLEWLDKLSVAIDKSFVDHRRIQIENNNDIKTEGVALHVILNDSIFIDFLKYLQNIGFIKDLQENYFESKCILNSFSALDNLPNQPNFSSIVHRDLRFYSGDFPIMINCLIMVDDFTIENGGTYLLAGSHLEKRKPSDEEFFNNSFQAIGKKGDILIFNANVWHSSAPNKTQNHRRAIPITISKSFMKQ
jgi:ectoine hydroxylase-related dioxygenase (phytanoyl-CoA dioxygenase family)